MALLTAAEAQARGVGVNMDVDDLQAIIDAEEVSMIQRYGPHGDGVSTVTETVIRAGRNVYLPRPFLSISTVSTAPYPGATATELDAALFYTWASRGYVELYPGGFLYDGCGEAVTVEYVPTDDRALRKGVLLDLVKLSIEESTVAATSVSGLGFSIEPVVTSIDFAARRTNLNRRLGYFEV